MCRTGESGISLPISRYLFITAEAIYIQLENSKPKSHVWLSHLLMSFLYNLLYVGKRSKMLPSRSGPTRC